MNGNINYTLKNDLCLGCGICEGTCPSHAISTVAAEGCYKPVVNSSLCKSDKGCHRCSDICPGLGVNLNQLGSDLFRNQKDEQFDKMVGYYNRCFTGYSNDYDIRYHSASGGMVSQFLIWLLENAVIDGAVVCSFNNSKPLMFETIVAHNREEVLKGRSSKYCPVSMHNVVQSIMDEPGSKYVVVGLPCHLQAIRKLMKKDVRFASKIYGLFSIYCSSGRTFYLTQHVFNGLKIDRNQLSYFQYRDEGCLGSLVALQNSGNKITKQYQGYYHPLRSFFVPRRCLFCVDHYGELGDISFGDIHIKPYSDDKVGINSIISKTSYWTDMLLKCESSGAIQLNPISFEDISKSQKMSFKKKGRNFGFIHLGEKLGWVMPKYDIEDQEKLTGKVFIDYFQNRVQQFLGSHKCFWPIVSLLRKKERIV